MKVKRNKQTKHNKFINEIIENKSENSAQTKGLMDELCDLLHKNGLQSQKCKDLQSYLSENEYDSEAIINDLCDTELDPFNHYTHSVLFVSYLNKDKYLAKVIKNHLRATHNDNDAITEFSLGPRGIFKYWDAFEGRDTYIDQPKYGTLKQECLNNNIYAMDIKTLHLFISKAYVYAHSYKGKQMTASDRSNSNNQFEIPLGLPLSISHLLVLLMYCNLDTLQRVYKAQGCRSIKANESLEDIKVRNKEIGHWYQTLFETIEFYGTDVSEKDIFYTGMNIRVVFDTFAPEFTCPVSTTTEWTVAHQFSKGVGAVMQLLAKSGCLDKYIDCEWISDYPRELCVLF